MQASEQYKDNAALRDENQNYSMAEEQYEEIKKLWDENAKLRRVVKAAGNYIDHFPFTEAHLREWRDALKALGEGENDKG